MQECGDHIELEIILVLGLRAIQTVDGLEPTNSNFFFLFSMHLWFPIRETFLTENINTSDNSSIQFFSLSLFSFFFSLLFIFYFAGWLRVWHNFYEHTSVVVSFRLALSLHYYYVYQHHRRIIFNFGWFVRYCC